jgi:hypothetical protein
MIGLYSVAEATFGEIPDHAPMIESTARSESPDDGQACHGAAAVVATAAASATGPLVIKRSARRSNAVRVFKFAIDLDALSYHSRPG